MPVDHIRFLSFSPNRIIQRLIYGYSLLRFPCAG